MRPVSYSGAAPAYQNLIAGRVDLMVDFITAAGPRVTAGQLKGLAITAEERSPQLPDVPTLREAGVSDFQIGGWFGLLAPAGTPAEVVRIMNMEINRLLRDQDVINDLAKLGVKIMGGSPEDLRGYLAKELKQWSALIEKLDLTPD